MLAGIRWRLGVGEHWLVSGPNGAGKTTLLRVIRGDQPILYGSGRRTYCLTGIGEDSLALAKTRIGYLAPEFHERLLRMELPLTTRELIMGGVHGTLYPSEPPTRTEHESVVRFAEQLALGGVLDEPMNELSFGQFRRALLARALAAEPRIFVLDEFVHGIDRQSRRLIHAALADAVRDGASLVVATHRREELPQAITHELQLEAGRVVAAGPLAKPAMPVRAVRGPEGSASASNGDGALLVRLENVDVFAERRPVLRGINWEIRRHEHWLVSGPNGAGKTTLAQLLYGRLRAAYGGKVERFGMRENLSVAEVRRNVALISDDEQLRYDWSIPVESVVASGFFGSVGLMQAPSAQQLEIARRLLEDFGIADLARRPFLELSFGQRRLVLVARALVRTPRLLILDEALNGFDRDARARILRRVESLAADETSVIMIGHHESDIPEWITNELHLEEGRITRMSSRAESRDRNSV